MAHFVVTNIQNSILSFKNNVTFATRQFEVDTTKINFI